MIVCSHGVEKLAKTSPNIKYTRVHIPTIVTLKLTCCEYNTIGTWPVAYTCPRSHAKCIRHVAIEKQ